MENGWGQKMYSDLVFFSSSSGLCLCIRVCYGWRGVVVEDCEEEEEDLKKIEIEKEERLQKHDQEDSLNKKP